MEQAELEERIKILEASVQNLLGPNPILDEWVKHIREYEDRLNKRVDALEKRIAKLAQAAYRSRLLASAASSSAHTELGHDPSGATPFPSGETPFPRGETPLPR